MSKKFNIDGSLQVTEKIVVQGDLEVKGSTNTVNQETLTIKDNFIAVNGNGTALDTAGMAGIVAITGSVVEEGAENPNATNGYSCVGVAGLRVDFAVAPSVAITLTPNYTLPLVQSGLYGQLMDTSTTIKSYVSGFTASAGVCFFF
jgi:hypothetical protein